MPLLKAIVLAVALFLATLSPAYANPTPAPHSSIQSKKPSSTVRTTQSFG
ncbi:hypothetical protein HDF16_006165 [Granulicella aggregans]|uniref:Uncharacterized protein n=1 Tax=Granulicella aggregans TaxID=474949 RepID=A0A7W8E7H8_9BACT|nr:hypothetical protein [Granulicella aggregans]MBB5061429.1 hypothetical protein [Granulicella aggregans]